MYKVLRVMQVFEYPPYLHTFGPNAVLLVYLNSEGFSKGPSQIGSHRKEVSQLQASDDLRELGVLLKGYSPKGPRTHIISF